MHTEQYEEEREVATQARQVGLRRRGALTGAAARVLGRALETLRLCPEGSAFAVLYVSTEMACIFIGRDLGSFLYIGFHCVVAPILGVIVATAILVRAAFSKQKLMILSWLLVPGIVIFCAWKGLAFIPVSFQ